MKTKIQTLSKAKMKIVLGLVLLALMIVSVSTSFEVAHAFTIPAGCWQTSHTQDCRNCGFLWLWEKNREKWTYDCPNGGGGSHTEYGSCDTCSW